MFRTKFLQVFALCLQFSILIFLFVPLSQGVGINGSILAKILQAFVNLDIENILVLSLYYLPTIISIIFMLCIQNSARYLLTAVSASFCLALTLVQYIFPAFAQAYLFSCYTTALYVLLILEIVLIAICIIAVSLASPSDFFLPNFDYKSNTQEIFLDDID